MGVPASRPISILMFTFKGYSDFLQVQSYELKHKISVNMFKFDEICSIRAHKNGYSESYEHETALLCNNLETPILHLMFFNVRKMCKTGSY